MIKGGYQIIDLKGIELDDTPVTFDGIYDKMLENVGKVCLVANIDVDNDPNFDHYFVQPIISGTTILCTVGNKTLKVNAEDGVSVEDGIVGGGSSGTSDYTDLSNKPSINSVTLAGNKTSHDLGLQNELTPGSNVSISEENVISATDTTYGVMTGATASTAGASGLVPAPAAGDEDKALCGDGTYHTMGGGGSSVLAVTLKAWSSTSPFPYPGPGTEKNVSFTGNYRDITSVGDPSTANVAYVDVILGVLSSSPSTVVARCRCNLIPKTSSSSSYTYQFTGVLISNENTPLVQGFKTICSGNLVYTISTQTWGLSGNVIQISQPALPGAFGETGFSPQSSVIDDIISYVTNNGGGSSEWTLNALDYAYIPATEVPGSNATSIFNTVLNFSGVSSNNNVLEIKGNPIPVKIYRSGATITLDYQGVVHVDANDVVNSDHQITLGTMILHLEFNGSVSTSTYSNGYIMLKSDVIK